MQKNREEYSLNNLEKLYTKLINQQPFSSPPTVNIPQLLNQIAKIIVWGQRQKNGVQNGDIFDFICEVKLFDLLLEIFTKCKNVETINAVIGFYNMLLSNINKPQTVMYLLSHPCILSMELTKFGTMASQLAEYYINFLKGLSRKIDYTTIHIFFNKRYPNFPLLFQTIRFFNHPENLVRTTCRNILLSVFGFCSLKNSPEKLLKPSLNQSSTQQTKQQQNNSTQLLHKKLSHLHQYLTSFPFCIYYIHQSNFVKQYWKIIDRVLDAQQGEEYVEQNIRYQLENLSEVLSDHEQLLIYLDDLLVDNGTKKLKKELNNLNPNNNEAKSKQSSFQEMFLSAFSNQCLSQLVISLCSIKKAYLCIKTSLLVFILLLNNIRNQCLTEAIIFILFSKYYPKTITHKLLNPIDTLLSYNRQWKFKGFWDGHQDKINQFCSKAFYQDKLIKGDRLNNSINDIKKKSSFGSDSMSVFGVSPNYYQREVQKLQRIFGLNILKFYNQGEQSTTIKPPKQQRSFAAVFYRFQQELPSLNAGNINLLNFDQNPVASNLYSFLESKDDTLVMLTLSLLQKIFITKNLNTQLVSFCKLNVNPKTRDFASVMTIEKIVISCIRIFSVDPPNFRICTYKQAAKVFLHFVKLYQNQDIELPKQLVFEAKKALKTSICRITPYMYSGKQWQKVIQLYLIITRQNSKFRKPTLRTYGLIPEEMSYTQGNGNNKSKPKFTDQLYQTIPRVFDQQIGRDLWIFIILKELLASVSTSKTLGMYLTFKVDIIPTKETKSKYDEGKSYNLQKDDHFSAFFKLSTEDKYKQCEVILLGGYLVVGYENKVEYKLPYEQTYLLYDKSDPRKMILQYNNIALSIQLENSKQTVSMRQNFYDNKNLLLKCHLSNLIKEIESYDAQLK